jgi:hypothetical protein
VIVDVNDRCCVPFELDTSLFSIIRRFFRLEISRDLPESPEISGDLQLSGRSPVEIYRKKKYFSDTRYIDMSTYVGGTAGAATGNFVGSRFFGETLRNIRLN